MALDPVTAVSDLVTAAITRIWPDAEKKQEALTAFASLKESDDFQAQVAQLKINLADAQSGNLFQAGWRPALAWSCVMSFIYHYLFFPIAAHYVTVSDIDANSFGLMMGVLTVLIGARTYDKSKGTDTK